VAIAVPNLPPWWINYWAHPLRGWTTSIGESGSPCRRPLWCLISWPDSPLRCTWVEAVESKLATRLHQTWPKPKWVRTSSKKDQDIESKALEISSFKKRLGTCRRWRSLIVCCTNMWLSWIHRPWTKALWLAATKSFNRGAKRFDKIFVTSFAKLWMRLIGWKSLGCRASAFFGIRVRYAELSNHNFLASPYCTTMMAAVKSAFINCQHDLKNRPVYPSRV